MEDCENYGIFSNHILDVKDMDFMSYDVFPNDFTNIDYIMSSDCLNGRWMTIAPWCTLSDLCYLATHNFDYNVCTNFIFTQDQIQDWTADEFADLSKGPDFLGTSNHTVYWIT